MDYTSALKILATHAAATHGDESLIATLAHRWLQASPAAMDDMLFANVLMRARISTDCGWRAGDCNALPPPPRAPAAQTIFCDGSCRDNGREMARAGFGVVVHRDGVTVHTHSAPIPSDQPQTNQRAELTALAYAIEYAVTSGLRTVIYTDSKYGIDCLTRWAPTWSRADWRKSDGKPVLHTDLIKPVFEMLNAAGDAVRLQHVAAHTDARDAISLGNAAADALALRATTVGF
jgi:ribonuclease HI